MKLSNLNIFGFNQKESITISSILLIIIAAILINLQISYRKSRDVQRKDDMRSVYDTLITYHEDFGFFPLSDSEGKILACEPYDVDTKTFSACDWGKDAIRDIFDKNYPTYLEKLPIDPRHDEGYGYFYISNGRRFQVYATLESKNEPEYDQKIIERGIYCGEKICNFGRSFSKTPLDKSLEEYENELDLKEK